MNGVELDPIISTAVSYVTSPEKVEAIAAIARNASFGVSKCRDVIE